MAADARPALGIMGFGAFGKLMAHHLRDHFNLFVYDPAFEAEGLPVSSAAVFAEIAVVASCPIIVLATPVGVLANVIDQINLHIRPGALILDVGSVKMLPAEILLRKLPLDVEIVATHPLFGPQSAKKGLTGLKIAVCPVRGRGVRVARFLRRVLKLNVIMTTPTEHDREAAMVQGLTHLIAKVLVQMEPLPTRMTTRSFDLLMEATEMVRHDAPEVFMAIERLNPYSKGVRRKFFDLAAAMDRELEGATQACPEMGLPL